MPLGLSFLLTGASDFIEIETRLLYLIHIGNFLNHLNIWMKPVLFDNWWKGIRFRCGTSLTLYVLISKFGAILIKNSLKISPVFWSIFEVIQFETYLTGQNNVGHIFCHTKFSSPQKIVVTFVRWKNLSISNILDSSLIGQHIKGRKQMINVISFANLFSNNSFKDILLLYLYYSMFLEFFL